MEIKVLNFASDGYESARSLNTQTAYKHGADKVFEFRLDDMDKEFRHKNEKILSEKRGCGYWLWKPYFINKVMNESNNDDWIVYSDSGMYFRMSLSKYVARLEKQNIDFISRATKFQEKQYTKRDVFVELGVDVPEYTDTLQRAASVVLIKNNKKNRQIVGEWLELAQDYHLITDDRNRNGKENYPEFIDHRHDQSLFSIVCKKYNLVYNRDIFLDMVLPYKGNALLVDHHSKEGKKIMAYFATIKRILLMIMNDFRLKLERK